MDLGRYGNVDDEGQLMDASFPEALEKYKTAGIIANTALHTVLCACRPGRKIVELCQMGDSKIMEDVAKVYPELKVKGQKGISFPTCVSLNAIAGHHSPFTDDKRTLHIGDMVKVDLGVHVDGFCAVVAHTIVMGPCQGKKADAIAAAWSAAQSALRLCKVGNKVSVRLRDSMSYPFAIMRFPLKSTVFNCVNDRGVLFVLGSSRMPR